MIRKMTSILFVTFAAIVFEIRAMAKDIPVSISPGQTVQSPLIGPFLLVEWNAADIAARRGSIRGEYVAMDGVAFGLSSFYQSRVVGDWKQKVVGAGASVAQYYQSLSLRGFFLRGEAALYFAQFEQNGCVSVEESRSGRTVGFAFDLVPGYRFVLSKYITATPALGVRRIVPDFFETRESIDGRTFSNHEGVWQPRIELSVGFGF